MTRPSRAVVVARREVLTAFETPVGWMVLAALPAASAAFFFVLGPFFAIGQADLRGFFSNLPWLLSLVGPALTMRSWAEERRSGADELLTTWPLTTSELVVGKFLGAAVVLALALAATGGIVATVALLGDLDAGAVVGGYLGAFLLGTCALAVGEFFSALTRSQVVAWIAAVAVLVALQLVGIAAGAEALPEAVRAVLLHLSLQTHYQPMTHGVVDLGGVLWLLALTGGFLAATGLVLEARREG